MSKTLRDAAAETTHTAAERGAAALEVAIDRLMPLLEQAADALAPYAEDARRQAADAKKNAARFAADTVEQLQPQINVALDKVTPAVERAQRTLQDDLIPKLVELLHEAAEHPAVVPAKELAAAKAELEPAAKKPSKGKRVAQVLAVGALVAGVAVAVKAFLGSKDSGWAAHEPSPAYTYTDSKAEPETFAEAVLDDDSAPVADEGDQVVEEVEQTEQVSDEAAETTAEDPAARYGEGSYIGSEPPEGYTIKGNERSMKYHTTESGGYDRTNADVWFVSEEAAQAAGFVRAQR